MNMVTIQIVSIYIYRNKAYLPKEVRLQSGVYVAVEPVHKVNVNREEILEVVRELSDAGHEIVPNYKAQESYKHDPILTATGAKSWKGLAKIGYCYGISWSQEVMLVEFYQVDKKGRWEYDSKKSRQFPADTPVEIAIDLILADYGSKSLETHSTQ